MWQLRTQNLRVANILGQNFTRKFRYPLVWRLNQILQRGCFDFSGIMLLEKILYHTRRTKHFRQSKFTSVIKTIRQQKYTAKHPHIPLHAFLSQNKITVHYKLLLMKVKPKISVIVLVRQTTAKNNLHIWLGTRLFKIALDTYAKIPLVLEEL